MSDTSSYEKTSLSLLTRVRQQDGVAWSELVELYGPLVTYWARQHQLKAEDVADVTQAVFWAVSRAIDTFEPQKENRDGSFRAWLWVITRNKIRDWARSQRLDQAEGGSSANGRMSSIPDPLAEEQSDDQVIQDLLMRAMHQIREQFQPNTWQAFWRTVIDGQSTELVAAELNMKAASIRQARSRVLRQLRQQLGDLD